MNKKTRNVCLTSVNQSVSAVYQAFVPKGIIINFRNKKLKKIKKQINCLTGNYL